MKSENFERTAVNTNNDQLVYLAVPIMGLNAPAKFSKVKE